ncbi:LLM class flavin-dependent oxidoreductase [Kribbella karoonensis]|uniref:LLM class flavin-dependent oxidoreductase n=1 Tax=Kribbella karoonensis TaxID=324851 RepID=UPI003CD05D51
MACVPHSGCQGRQGDRDAGTPRPAWSGEPVRHHGEHYTVDDMESLPRPIQRPGVPVWVAGFPGNLKPRRRRGSRLVLSARVWISRALDVGGRR